MKYNNDTTKWRSSQYSGPVERGFFSRENMDRLRYAIMDTIYEHEKTDGHNVLVFIEDQKGLRVTRDATLGKCEYVFLLIDRDVDTVTEIARYKSHTRALGFIRDRILLRVEKAAEYEEEIKYI